MVSHPEAMGGPVKREEGAKVKFDDFKSLKNCSIEMETAFLIRSRGRKNLNATNVGFLPGIRSRPGN